MSLYGSGRREGILSVVVIALIVAFVHGAAAARAQGWPFEWQEPAAQAALAALGGALFYRLLRSLERSRYTAFLAGTAYALAPWFAAVTMLPREQCAAALAPLALEAASRSVRPDHSRRWLPWAGICIALPFIAGLSTVACLAALLAIVQLVRATIEVESEDRAGRIVGVIGAVATGTLASFSFVWLDLLQPWFGISIAPTTVEVLAAHRSPSEGVDFAALVRLPGPVLLLFAMLGVLRWQRRASNIGWFMIGAIGIVPTVLLAQWPAFAALRTDLPVLASVAAASWWTTLLATTVLGAAGLDDFLELPTRRATAQRLLLVLAAVAGPLLLLDARVPGAEWPLVVTLLALAALLAIWRRLGMLQFKNVLAVVAVIALVAPALQVLAVTERISIDVLPSTPITEVDPLAAFERTGWLRLASQPLWYYSGLLVALLWSCSAATLLFNRRRKVSPPPTKARAAITKKAAAGQRSNR